MGGVKTDVNGATPIPGLYAAGEVACVSVHGGNRLGTNSLVDILVYGRRSGRSASEFVRQVDFPALPANPEANVMGQVDRLFNSTGKESAAELRLKMQEVMTAQCGVFRTGEGLEKVKQTLAELQACYPNISIKDHGKKFNTELLEALELGYLLDLAEATAFSAAARTESRGAHARVDFQKRDDVNWLKHTLAFKRNGKIELDYKPVVITRFEPKERKY
jgi:succinate dehydrogenase / fumarate reductase flavoprotein subunit